MANLSFKSTRRNLTAALLASCLIAGGATTAMAGDRASETEFASRIDQAPASALHGPRKSIAVMDFSANGAFLQQYGGWSEGGGLAAMLASELTETGRFRVVTRSHIDAALYEQRLNVNGLTARSTARPGELIGAQYLVRGAVTDFTLSEKGNGISVGGNFGGVLGAISPRTQKGRISIDFTVVDSTSGEVVASFPVTRKIKSTAIAASVSHNRMSVGGDSFKNTPLGEAAREVIAEAVAELTDALENKTWTAHVAQVRSDALYVNAGADSGLRSGDRLTILRVVDEIIDPVTGALLGVEKQRIGDAVIENVAEQYATARYSAQYVPEPGDLLIFDQNAPAQLSLNVN